MQLRKFDGGCQSLAVVNSRSARKKGSQEGGRESLTVLISKLNDSVGLEMYDTKVSKSDLLVRLAKSSCNSNFLFCNISCTTT